MKCLWSQLCNRSRDMCCFTASKKPTSARAAKGFRTNISPMRDVLKLDLNASRHDSRSTSKRLSNRLISRRAAAGFLSFKEDSSRAHSAQRAFIPSDPTIRLFHHGRIFLAALRSLDIPLQRQRELRRQSQQLPRQLRPRASILGLFFTTHTLLTPNFLEHSKRRGNQFDITIRQRIDAGIWGVGGT